MICSFSYFLKTIEHTLGYASVDSHVQIEYFHVVLSADSNLAGVTSINPSLTKAHPDPSISASSDPSLAFFNNLV